MKNILLPKKKTSNPSKVLILGGTSDARRLATQLIEMNFEVIYSIAGLVRTPALDCEIHIGGFTAHGGLDLYIQQTSIAIILDATHPYALNISHKAALACVQTNIQYVRFERPQWQPLPNDSWALIEQWSQLIPKLSKYKHVFLTAGQVPELIMQQISKLPCELTLRTAKQPEYILPENIKWIKAIGPFDENSEKQWLINNQIDLIVSKNSGGQATYGKIVAARELNIDVIMFQRPASSHVNNDQSVEFNTLDQCVEHIKQLTNKV